MVEHDQQNKARKGLVQLVGIGRISWEHSPVQTTQVICYSLHKEKYIRRNNNIMHRLGMKQGIV